ncbi:hypothetical protein N9L26_01955, partial [Candidatus Pacebacteria bacterium]|nr:hypothetical protein [Candidatus Paceibacterota bacterium]
IDLGIVFMEFTREDIPEEFPIDMTIDELKDIIRKAHTAITESGFDTEKVTRLSPIVQVAQAELQQRASDKLAHSANILAVVALIAGLIPVVVEFLPILN